MTSIANDAYIMDVIKCFLLLSFRSMRQSIEEDRSAMPCVQVQPVLKGLDLDNPDGNNNKYKSSTLEDFEIIKTIGNSHFLS